MITLNVNGRDHPVDVAADTPLLWVLRETLGLTGTKFGCGMAQCGACTVHVNGEPTRSCVTPVSAIEGKRVVTIEYLPSTTQGNTYRAVRQAWIDKDVVQCGYCQSGQIMAAVESNAAAARRTARARAASFAKVNATCATAREAAPARAPAPRARVSRDARPCASRLR